MPEKETFGTTQRAQEEDYFHKRDRELVEKLRAEAEGRNALRQLGEMIGISDETVLRDLQRLGFGQQTAKLVDLTPLVQVAWSDGSVAPQERAQILKVAGLHGVEQGSPASSMLAGWLEARPAEEVFQATSRAIRGALEVLAAEERENKLRTLLRECAQVAAVSGGFLRLGSKISTAEQLAIRQTAVQLGFDGDRIPEIVQGID